jgi:hypothetical protein
VSSSLSISCLEFFPNLQGIAAWALFLAVYFLLIAYFALANEDVDSGADLTAGRLGILALVACCKSIPAAH